MKILKLTMLLVIISVAVAQPGHKPPGRENIEIMKKWKLTEYLNLTEEQAEKFFPRLNEMENRLKDINEKKKTLTKELNNMSERDDVKNKRINQIIDEIYELEVDKLKVRKTHFKNIDDILSTEQKAKYTVFEKKFKKRMKDQFRERDGFKRGRGQSRF
ncbi:MAG: hypothetical protein ISR90_06095 [Candidatus Marinimicrobia bacterium]|nr:hypothetical protein [Candidatus Neomarinimicrobiota bacterium]MBL7023604.1 hypothetical protein [Candidatus Neomarinimicrobiota bacterium]MBL7109898.1 hypothetical protein [Candidatus Neomarinimicrobiota bacterium]